MYNFTWMYPTSCTCTHMHIPRAEEIGLERIATANVRTCFHWSPQTIFTGVNGSPRHSNDNPGIPGQSGDPNIVSLISSASGTWIQCGEDAWDEVTCRSISAKEPIIKGLLRKETCKDKASYASLPPCISYKLYLVTCHMREGSSPAGSGPIITPGLGPSMSSAAFAAASACAKNVALSRSLRPCSVCRGLCGREAKQVVCV